jgi:hypothetical protein
MLNLLLSAFLIGLITSCGQNITAGPPSEYIYKTDLSLEPLMLKKQSSFCREDAFSALRHFNLKLFLRGNYTSLTVDFMDLLDKNFLRSKNADVIIDSHHGEHWKIIDDGRGTRLSIVQGPSSIEICTGERYESETVESAALSSAYYIRKAHHKIKEVAPYLYLSPITLKVGPRVEKTIRFKSPRGLEEQTFIMTDNAFYQPATASITFLPHSQEARRAGFDVSFWEVPMVAAHEYGHHIFQQIFYRKAALPSLHGHLCFDGPSAHNILNFDSTSRKVFIGDVLLALNEGFSDLISYYVLDNHERQLTGVRCLEDSRDVGRSFFKDGRFKYFSDEVMSSFFGTTRSSGPKSCERTDFQDVHTIGAIFAHNADKFLETLTRSKTEKLSVLIDWLMILGQEHGQRSRLSPETYFREAILLFLRQAYKKFDKEFDHSICAEVNSIYPDLKNYLDQCN